MPLPLLGLLGAGAASGGIGAVTNMASSAASKIPLIGPLISGVTQGIGNLSSSLLPGLFK